MKAIFVSIGVFCSGVGIGLASKHNLPAEIALFGTLIVFGLAIIISKLDDVIKELKELL